MTIERRFKWIKLAQRNQMVWTPPLASPAYRDYAVLARYGKVGGAVWMFAR